MRLTQPPSKSSLNDLTIVVDRPLTQGTRKKRTVLIFLVRPALQRQRFPHGSLFFHQRGNAHRGPQPISPQTAQHRSKSAHSCNCFPSTAYSSATSHSRLSISAPCCSVFFGLLSSYWPPLGSYCVTAYAVEQRTRKIGIRMAPSVGFRSVFLPIMNQGAGKAAIAGCQRSGEFSPRGDSILI